MQASRAILEILKMKAKNILNIGLAGLLSLHIAGCAKPNFKQPSLSDYAISEKRFEDDFNTTLESNCIIYKQGPYHFKEADANVFIKEFACAPSREPKGNDRYVVKAGYMFLIEDMIGEGIEKEVCIENEPYIIVKELNNGLSVWLIDPESNGKDRIALDGRFPKRLIPKPFTKECY